MSTPSNILVPNNATGVDVATNSITWNGVASNMQLANVADPITGTSASVTAAGTPGANGISIQGMSGGVALPISGAVTVSGTPNVAVTSLPGTPSQDGTDATGVTPPSGASGIRGWLSAIWSQFNTGSAKTTATLAAGTAQFGSLVPWKYTLITSSGNTVIKGSPGILGGIMAVSTSSQAAGNVSIYDNATTSSGNLVYIETSASAGQIIQFGQFGVQMTNGIVVNCAAVPTGALLVLWL